MTEKYILAIDEGTTSTRSIIFNHDGQKVADAQREFPQYFPEPGWVEHNANEIWNAVLSTIANAFIKSGIQPNQIAGIGITNQRETTVIWTRQLAYQLQCGGLAIAANQRQLLKSLRTRWLRRFNP